MTSPEERAAQRAAYAERDRQHAAQVRARRAQERARAKAAVETRLAAEVAQIRSEVRIGLRPPRGERVVIDAAAMLLIGPEGAVGVGAHLLPTLAVLAGKGRHPMPDLLAAGRWPDEATLRVVLGAFRPKLMAVGLRICRRKTGLRIAKVRPG